MEEISSEEVNGKIATKNLIFDAFQTKNFIFI